MPNLAANGQDPSGCAARNLENDPWSAWYGTQNEQANGFGAPNGCGNTGGEQSRFHTVHGPGGMTASCCLSTDFEFATCDWRSSVVVVASSFA